MEREEEEERRKSDGTMEEGAADVSQEIGG